MTKTFGILFILTGVFAVAGGLYTWGDGSIFSKTELLTALIPWADIILTGPVSLVSGYGLIRNRKWGSVVGLMTSGIYIFGSVLVFITVFWNKDYSVFLLTPSISGFLIGVGYVVFQIKERALYEKVKK